MASQATLVKITKEPLPSTRVLIDFEDGTQLEFPSLQTAKDSVSLIDTDVQMARQLIIAWWLARQPDGSNVNIVEGKTLTFDLSAANAIRVQ